MDLPEGVYEVTLACGETRYQARATFQGRLTLLGWWTTPVRARKAYLRATNARKDQHPS